jgi:hypothetical protein
MGRPRSDVGTAQLFGICALAPVVGATFGALDVIASMFASDRKPHMTSTARHPHLNPYLAMEGYGSVLV